MRTTTITCDECGTEEVKQSKGGSMSSDTDEPDTWLDLWQYHGKDSKKEDLDLTFCSAPCLIKNMTERIK